MLHPLAVAETYEALAPLAVAAPDDHYADRDLQTALLFLTAAGVARLAHVDDQPVTSWGMVLGTARRPGAATLDRYLHALQAQDEGAAAPPAPAGADQPLTTAAPPAPASPVAAAAVGQIQPAGPIAQARQQTLVARVAAVCA